MARQQLTPTVSLLFTLVLGLSSSVACERADANIGDDAAGAGQTASGGNTTMPPAGLGGEMPGGDGDVPTGDGDLFNGSCPVEPCPEPGDGDVGGDGDVVGDGDLPGATSLITNGDFAGGGTGWNGQNGVLSTAAGTGCVSRDGLESPILGWDSVSIDAGSYTFAFDVVGAGTFDLVAKMGGTTDPWTAYTEQTLTAVSAGRQTFDFTMTETATVGAAFIFTTGDPCIDNVSLVKN